MLVAAHDSHRPELECKSEHRGDLDNFDVVALRHRRPLNGQAAGQIEAVGFQLMPIVFMRLAPQTLMKGYRRNVKESHGVGGIYRRRLS